MSLDSANWTEVDSWKMIEGYIAEKEAIKSDVMAAIERGYSVTTVESE